MRFWLSNRPLPQRAGVFTALSILSLLSINPSAVRAQTVQQPAAPPASVPTDPSSPRDVPVGHFAYDAIRTLTRDGYLEGFPRDGDVFQGRVATRYEMATLVSRIVGHAQGLLRAHDNTPAASKENLALVGKLVGEFRLELAVIGVDLAKLAKETPEIAGMQGPSTTAGTPPSPKTRDNGPKSLAQLVVVPERSGDEASLLLKRLQNKISGYFQFREDALIGKRELFRGTGAGGTGQRPTITAPAVGGPSSGFLVRRGRVRIGEQITPHDEFVFQLDLPTNSEVNVRDAYVRVLDFPARDFAFRAGQFAFAYGFEYLYSSRSRETPERALGYSDSSQASLMYKQTVAALGGEVTPGSVLPFFFNQDRDIGVEIAWGAPRSKGMVPRAALALIQGEGRGTTGQRSLNNAVDMVASVELLDRTGPDLFSFGLSYYKGTLPARSAAPVGTTVAPFTDATRAFGGAYARYQVGGHEYRAEYSGGLFEVTPDRALYLNGNRFNAWYVVTRQPLLRKLEGYLKYDEYNPARRNALIAGVKGSDLSRKTLSLGLLYQHSQATRFRINYSQGMSPYDASRPHGDPLRSRIGLLQTEIQVVY